jgi:hypothetical protein
MIIDSLVVTLGLDPSQFTKGQREALDAFKRTKEEAVRGAKDVEYQAGRTGDALGGIKTQTLQMFSAFTGAAGLLQFATQAIHAGAAAGRLSRNLGVSVDVISRFQGLASVFGGSAEGMAQSFAQMSDALQGWKIGDVKAIVADFRALGSAGGTVMDINKGIEQTFLDLAQNLRALHDKDPASGGYWQRRLGIDPGLYDAMIQKNETFAEQLRKIRGLTDDEAEAAGRAERQWNNLLQTATKAGQNFILDQVQKTIDDINDPQTILGMVFGPKKGAPASLTATAYRNSIASIESAGSGGYAAVGPVTKSGDRAYGRYQIMGNNIGEWSQAALGKKLSIVEFMASPAAQDAVFDHRFGQYVKQFGNPQDAASAWFTGRPLSGGAGMHDMLGTSGVGYAARFTAGLGGSSSSTSTSISVSGPITINAGPNADGAAIASKFMQTLKNQSFAAQANSGQN